MGYISQFYTWATGNTVTAARLNGNISAVVDGLSDGTKDINIAKLKIGGADIIDGSQNITNAGDITTTSSTSSKPVWLLKNTNADANSAELQFYKSSASVADNDDVGKITFYGDDDGGGKDLHAQILVESVDVTAGTEDGKMTIYTMKAGTSTASITIESSNVTLGGTLTNGTATLTAGAWSGITTLGMGGDLTIYEAANDANPKIFLGSSSAETFSIQTVFTSGGQLVDYVEFKTVEASSTADKGEYRFLVDSTAIIDINDAGLNIKSGLALYIADTSVLNATTLGSGVIASSLTSVGTLTTVTVDDITINANTISSAGDSSLTITAKAGEVVSIESVSFDGVVVAVVTTLATSSTINSQTISSAANLTGSLTIAGAVSVDDTTESTSGTTGSFHTDGGIGAAKNIVSGDDIFSTAWTDISASSTINGWSSFTTKLIKYKAVGKLVFVFYHLEGTSNSSSTNFTVPLTSKNDTIEQFLSSPSYGKDNGGNLAANTLRVDLAANSTQVDFYPIGGDAAWTTSGTKIIAGQFFYEAD